MRYGRDVHATSLQQRILHQQGGKIVGVLGSNGRKIDGRRRAFLDRFSGGVQSLKTLFQSKKRIVLRREAGRHTGPMDRAGDTLMGCGTIFASSHCTVNCMRVEAAKDSHNLGA